jgi:ketosteroid isomerase-like protein
MASANLQLVRSVYAAWERGDWSSVEWAHDQIELEAVGLPDVDETWHGLAGIAAGWRRWLSAWEDYSVKADEYVELDDERVLVLIHVTGRGRSSGLDVEQMHAEGANVFHIRGGKVLRIVAYVGRDRAFADLGLPRERASAVPIQAAYAAISAMDADALIALCHPDVSFQSRITALDKTTYRGYEGVRQYIDNLAEAFEFIDIESSDVLERDDRAVVENRFRARGRGSGVEVEHRYHAAGRARDGKLLWWGLFDSREEALAAVDLAE